MTTAATTLPIARLTCHAPHRDPRKRKKAEPCGGLLGDHAGAYQFVTTADKLPPQPDGDAYVLCAKCQKWNRFRVVPPETTVAVPAPDATLEDRVNALPPLQQRAAIALAQGLKKAPTARLLQVDRGTVIAWSKRPDFAETVQQLAAANAGAQASVTQQHIAAALTAFFAVLEKDTSKGIAHNLRWFLSRTVFQDIELAKKAAGGSSVNVNVQQQQAQTQGAITSVWEKRRAALSDTTAVAKPA